MVRSWQPSWMAAPLRGVVLRCPLCGASWPRTRMVELAARCGTCRLKLDRGEDDYFLGAYTINLLVALLAVAGLAIAGLALRLGSWAIYGIGLPLVAALAIGFHPISRLLWLAFDLQFRPATERDFERNP